MKTQEMLDKAAQLAADAKAGTRVIAKDTLMELTVATDEHGQRIMNTSPAYAEYVRDLYATLYPGDGREIIGLHGEPNIDSMYTHLDGDSRAREQAYRRESQEQGDAAKI